MNAKFSRAATLFAATLIAGSVILPALAAERPDYEKFKSGTFLRYLNAGDGRIEKTPSIGLSFGERVLHATLDSGSTGVVVAAAFIPNFDQLPVIGEGKLTYTSSGRVMLGSWVTTSLTLSGRDGASVTTEPMPVLAVTRVACLETARDCRPNDDPRDIAMVGIGFAREGDRQGQSTPDKNPVLNVAAEGEHRKGYVLTPEGIHIGLTAENTRGEFRFVKLERQADLPDWKGVPACISLGGQTPPACGSMLVDTGVGAMFMTVPSSQVASGPLADGTSVAILLGTDAASEPLYSFTSGDMSPMTPSAIHLDVSDKPPFVNTSFHFLNGFDVLYDADGGYAGFRKH
ncbi:hypothetical protein SAMN02745157_2025 [Kaistia soli DSM 19436]|uniref:Aspartyl protease n=1 Tax=Kaistia soli DSM 19436 TaxID=1122133 RepID=A0A1M5A5V2_9HYPH|nr:hypothetical protein [Kaistia soli]SHF25709.1 hypothetical protein SAMN02745157_2025 [Kaistia soli DSM 19436]